MCSTSPKSPQKSAPLRSQNFVTNGFFGEQGKNGTNTVCIREYFNDAQRKIRFTKSDSGLNALATCGKEDYSEIAEYIENNPAKWLEDRFYL